MVIKQLNIRSDNCYFYNDLVNLKDFDPSFIKLEESETANNIFIYHVNYAGKHLLRLYIRGLDGYFTEEKREGWSNKYLNITLTDSNDCVSINYANVWKVIRDDINKINNGVEGEYGKDLMKINVNSDDDLPLNKVMKFHVLTFVVRYVFKKGNEYRPHIFLTDCLYDNV